ncbi:MAG: hypothetical protein ACOYT4_05345 [Nanoarchaeota archaeon]
MKNKTKKIYFPNSTLDQNERNQRKDELIRNLRKTLTNDILSDFVFPTKENPKPLSYERSYTERIEINNPRDYIGDFLVLEDFIEGNIFDIYLFNKFYKERDSSYSGTTLVTKQTLTSLPEIYLNAKHEGLVMTLARDLYLPHKFFKIEQFWPAEYKYQKDLENERKCYIRPPKNELRLTSLLEDENSFRAKLSFELLYPSGRREVVSQNIAIVKTLRYSDCKIQEDNKNKF